MDRAQATCEGKKSLGRQTPAKKSLSDEDGRFTFNLPHPGQEGQAMNRVRTFRHRVQRRHYRNAYRGSRQDCNQESHYVCCEWSRRPTRRVICEYRRRVLTVWQNIANETELKVMELLQVEAHLWEAWIFEPVCAPVKIKEVDGLA